MRERIVAQWKLRTPELMIGGMVLAFVLGGLIWGTPHTILRVCSGIVQRECPPDEWVELNPAAGLLAAAVAIIVLLVVDQIAKRRQP